MKKNNFSLRETLESGQIFRYKYVKEGAYIAHGEEVFLIREDETTDHPSKDWIKYFLRTDQPTLQHEHPYVQKAIKHTNGVRILRQDSWECLVSFIISQNNNQTRITKNIHLLTKTYGKPLKHGFYTFPQPHELGTEEEMRKLGLGYRARYLADIKHIDPTRLDSLRYLPYETAKKQLTQINGIGPKVADCILLFSLGFDEACPEDTWIKKVFKKTGLTKEVLGKQAGLYQQLLFHYARRIEA
jgi:N-glycosylase/DNA lyase